MEDPVGSGVRHGHDEIRELYSRIEKQDRTVELAVDAHQRQRGGVPGAADRHHRGQPRPRIDGIDVMTFDDAGQDHVDAGVLVGARTVVDRRLPIGYCRG